MFAVQSSSTSTIHPCGADRFKKKEISRIGGMKRTISCSPTSVSARSKSNDCAGDDSLSKRAVFDPLDVLSTSGYSRRRRRSEMVNRDCDDDDDDDAMNSQFLVAAMSGSTSLALCSALDAFASDRTEILTTTQETQKMIQKSIDPFMNFQPVCPASDGVFRVGQSLALSLAGDSNIENYRPLINDVLIRVRTELCVLESFVRETAIPFVQTKGLGWVLPRHETSETYLAGVVFVVGANFILLGSTKVVAIIAIYHDLSLGLLCRVLGKVLGFMSPGDVRKQKEEEFEKLMQKQMEEMKKIMLDQSITMAKEREQKTSEISQRYAIEMEKIKSTQDERSRADETSGLQKFRQGASVVAIPLKVYGTVSQKTREILEIFDTFCSRYFVAFTVSYIIAKTLHYVVFPDVFG